MQVYFIVQSKFQENIFYNTFKIELTRRCTFDKS